MSKKTSILGSNMFSFIANMASKNIPRITEQKLTDDEALNTDTEKEKMDIDENLTTKDVSNDLKSEELGCPKTSEICQALACDFKSELKLSPKSDIEQIDSLKNK